jgi:hypothetical protein
MTDEGASRARIERIVDERLERQLASFGESGERLDDGSKRTFLALLTGGVAGYGASTFSGTDEPPAGVSEDADEEESAEGGVAVTSAEGLEHAVEEESAIRVRGTLDVTDVAPITVPQNTVVCGEGVYRRPNDTIGGDGLYAEANGPILDVAGNDSAVFGLSIVNTGSEGDALSVTGFSPRVSHTDLYATRYGIDCDPEETATEPRLNFNRVVSTTGSSAESTGIRIANMHDAKVINNIVAGYDVGIDVGLSSAIVSLNHTYTYPADSSSVGVRIGDSSVRVINNRVEGLNTDAGVVVDASERSIVSQNLIQVGDGADGIAIEVEELVDSFVTENLLEGQGDDSGATAVSGANLQAFWRSVVGPNTAENFESEGVAYVSEAAGVDGTPSANRYFPHQIVENRDDDTVWLRASDGMRRIA